MYSDAIFSNLQFIYLPTCKTMAVDEPARLVDLYVLTTLSHSKWRCHYKRAAISSNSLTSYTLTLVVDVRLPGWHDFADGCFR